MPAPPDHTLILRPAPTGAVRITKVPSSFLCDHDVEVRSVAVRGPREETA